MGKSVNFTFCIFSDEPGKIRVTNPVFFVVYFQEKTSEFPNFYLLWVPRMTLTCCQFLLSFAFSDGISEGQTAAQNSLTQTKFTESQHEFSVPFYYISHNLKTGIWKKQSYLFYLQHLIISVSGWSKILKFEWGGSVKK